MGWRRPKNTAPTKCASFKQSHSGITSAERFTKAQFFPHYGSAKSHCVSAAAIVIETAVVTSADDQVTYRDVVNCRAAISYHIISYQGFLVRPLLREPRPQVHYKSQPDATAQSETQCTEKGVAVRCRRLHLKPYIFYEQLQSART